MISQAQEAYLNKDVEQSKRAHQVEDVNLQPRDEHKEHHQQGGEYIKSMVYGGLDGLVTTFSVVTGVAGVPSSHYLGRPFCRRCPRPWHRQPYRRRHLHGSW